MAHCKTLPEHTITSIELMMSKDEGYSLLENACWNRFKKHQYGPFQFTNRNRHIKLYYCSILLLWLFTDNFQNV